MAVGSGGCSAEDEAWGWALVVFAGLRERLGNGAP